MTKKPTTLQQLMDDEQPPKSPEALDQAILAHAHARAKPAMRSGWLERLIAGWLPLLAAASVASVAVLIVLQQPPSAVLHDSTDYASKVQGEPAGRELAVTTLSQHKTAADAAANRQTERAAEGKRFMAQPLSLLSPSDDRLASASAPVHQAPSEAADFAPELPARARSAAALDDSSGAVMSESIPAVVAATMADSSAEMLTATKPKSTAKTLSVRPQTQTADRPAAITSSATFIAQGLQQQWQLQIGNSQVRFVALDGTRHDFSFQLSSVDQIEQSQPLLLSNEHHWISITLHGAGCEAERLVDQQRVTVVFDGQSLAGCGKSNH